MYTLKWSIWAYGWKTERQVFAAVQYGGLNTDDGATIRHKIIKTKSYKLWPFCS